VHDDRILVEKRIERELWQRILPHLYPERVPMSVEAWHAPGEPVGYDEAIAQRFEKFEVGTAWGRPWSTTWFRCTGDVPAAWIGDRIEAVVDFGFSSRGAGFQAEGLVWTADGPLQGIHPRRTAVHLPEARPGTQTIVIEAAANPNLGVGFRWP